VAMTVLYVAAIFVTVERCLLGRVGRPARSRVHAG
jgi:hypothetical protein